MQKDQQIAQKIVRQIGPEAFAMMGTGFNRAVVNDGLSFRVKGSKVCNHVTVVLDASDTYTVTFHKIGRAPKYNTTQHSVSDVYFDMLHDVIERHTGLYLSLQARNA